MKQTTSIPDSDSASEPLLPADVIERRFGLPSGFLARHRSLPAGPRYFKLAARTVRYRPSDVAAWLDDCACKSGVPAARKGRVG